MRNRSRSGALTIAAVITAVATACPAPDQERAGTVDTAATDAAATGTISEAEAFNEVSAINAAGIATSTLAQQRARNESVRDFAERVLNDHQEVQGRFDRIAMDLGVVQQPFRTDTLTGMFEQYRSELSGLQAGADFDRRYMDVQVELHENAVQVFNRAAGVSNEQMRSAIQELISTAQQHLERAREIRAGLGAAG